jgi:hypothetical protein
MSHGIAIYSGSLPDDRGVYARLLGLVDGRLFSRTFVILKDDGRVFERIEDPERGTVYVRVEWTSPPFPGALAKALRERAAGLLPLSP